MRRNGKNYNSQLGAAMVEVALLIPVVLLLGFCAIEYTRILRIHQSLGVISREAAAVAFRDCTGIGALDIDSANTVIVNDEGRKKAVSCLGGIARNISERTGTRLPELRVRISLYARPSPFTHVSKPFEYITEVCASVNVNGCNDARFHSKFTKDSQFLSDQGLKSTMTRYVIFAESYYVAQPVMAITAILFPQDRVFHEVVAY